MAPVEEMVEPRANGLQRQTDRRGQAERLLGLPLPEVRFSADRIEVRPGEPVTLQWHVDGAEEVVYWANPYEPIDLVPLSWVRIAELGGRVEPRGEIVVRPDRTAAYYVLARSALGARGEEVVIQVRSDPAPTSTEPGFECQPGPAALQRMTDHPLRIQPEPWRRPQPAAVADRVAELVRSLDPFPSGPRGGMVTLGLPVVTVSQPVIFKDEPPPTLNWSTSGATCIQSGFSRIKSVLVPGQDKDPAFSWSGTASDGGSYAFGGSPACSMAASGQMVFSQSLLQTLGTGNYTFWISAGGASGQGTYGGVWFDLLPVPKFTGAAAAPRQALIRSYLKDIDQKLRSGGILSDATLDTAVAAFKHNRLSKYEVWWRLLLEVQNLQNLVFQCADNPNGGGASWGNFSNTINLKWNATTGAGPSTYALLHELVHKCGFNGRLLTWYSHAEIEEQTDLVASSCYP
jgi:hypothetical protein